MNPEDWFTKTSHNSAISYTREISKMFHTPSKYFSIFNNKAPASWVVHITRAFLICYSCLHYSSMPVSKKWKARCCDQLVNLIIISFLKYYSCVPPSFTFTAVLKKELCNPNSFKHSVFSKVIFPSTNACAHTHKLRGVSTRIVLLMPHNCTRHVKKFWGRRKN